MIDFVGLFANCVSDDFIGLSASGVSHDFIGLSANGVFVPRTAAMRFKPGMPA